MTMITPSYLGETIEYSSLHACRSTLEDPTVIFVGRSGVTTREAIKRSLELLEQARSSPVLAVVLNAVDFSSPEYRYGYAYK